MRRPTTTRRTAAARPPTRPSSRPPTRAIAATLALVLALAACSGTGSDDAAVDTDSDSDTDQVAQSELEERPGAVPDLADEPAEADRSEQAADLDAPDDVAEPVEPRFPDDVTFADYGVSDFVATTDLATSTFATDGDTASFTLAQAWMEREGVLPPAEAIRVEEWVNAVDHRYADPEPGETWRIVTDGTEPWWDRVEGDDAETTLLRVGLQAERQVERAPLSITLVIDTSGSMNINDRVALVQESVDGLLGQLTADDQVAVVEYGSTARMVAEPTSDLDPIRDAVADLTPGGSTNAEAGLAMGFDTARGAYRPETNNVVVLLSDGVANVGATGPDEILARITDEAEDGIVLHSVGVGMDNYNEVLLERLANDAGGAYAYIDRLDEAAELFTGTLPVLTPVAHDVKAQVEFDEAAVSSWRLIGYENRLMDAEDFRDDDVGGGYVGAGHAVTALYEIVPTGAVRDLGTVTVRWADPATDQVDETTSAIQLASADEDASVTLGTAAAMAAAGEHLRGSPHVDVDLGTIADRLQATRDVQDAQMADLLRAAAAATQPQSPPRQRIDTPGIEVEDRAG